MSMDRNPAAVAGGAADAASERPCGASASALVEGGLRSRSARRWYVGAAISLLWLVLPLALLYPSDFASPAGVAVIVGSAVFAVLYVIAPPLAAILPPRRRWAPATVLFALSLAATWAGGGIVDAASFWPFVVSVVAVSTTSRWLSYAVSAALAAAALVVELTSGAATPAWLMPLITLWVGIAMTSFAANVDALRRLRAARQELAVAAVDQERYRFARDMHDVLGHSLSAIAVKSELAQALAVRDAEAAAREIGEVHELARATLADVRAVVSGYRRIDLAAELDSARALLGAAGIVARVDGTAEEVPEAPRELFAWVVREACTNVIRHSGARSCWIRVAADRVRVADDGTGARRPEDASGGAAVEGADRSGSGLIGIRERVDALGGTLALGRGPEGGFVVEVRI